MAELTLTGGCLCGAVRFEVTEPLVSAGYCHCTRCQRRTGTAASASARIAPGSLRVLAGEELVTDYRPPDGTWRPVFDAGQAGMPANPQPIAVDYVRGAAFIERHGSVNAESIGVERHPRLHR